VPSVAEARERARASILKARSGVHPVKERQQIEAARKAHSAANAFTFGKLAGRYVEEYTELNTKPSSVYETRRLLTRVAQFFGDYPLHDVKKADVIELISDRRPNRYGTSGLVSATNLLVVVRKALKWAVAHDLIAADPPLNVPKPLTKKPTRDRVLTNPEIVSFWRGCDEIGYPFGPL
jgi:hypothetical protein